jgi:hypothetical protein
MVKMQRGGCGIGVVDIIKEEGSSVLGPHNNGNAVEGSS